MNRYRNFRRPPSPRPLRRGLASVELAVCLPVLVLIVFASIEACSMIFLQQSLQTTAYETARFAVNPRSTAAVALARGEGVLADRGVQGADITLDPPNVESIDAGIPIEITVTAPLASNRLFPAFFYGDQNLQATAVMLRE